MTWISLKISFTYLYTDFRDEVMSSQLLMPFLFVMKTSINIPYSPNDTVSNELFPERLVFYELIFRVDIWQSKQIVELWKGDRREADTVDTEESPLRWCESHKLAYNNNNCQERTQIYK